MNTVQVRLIDGTTVTVPEPAWCLGQHQDGEHLVDLAHDGPEIALTVQTARGPVEVLDALLTQPPYATQERDRKICVAVLLSNDWYRFDPDGLHAFADAITAYAVQLRGLARQLAELLHAQP